MSHSFDKALAEIIQMYDCTVVNGQESRINRHTVLNEPQSSINGIQIRDNVLYVSSFNREIELNLRKILEEKPPIDTLFIGKYLTDREMVLQIRYILNIPFGHEAIKNLIFEDSKRYCFENGLLIDKTEMSIKAYAPGRTDEIIVIPEGIITLERECLNYNRHVRRIILPSSIRNIKGIDSLPELEEIIIEGNTGKYITKGGMIFTNNGSKLPYLVPPAHKNSMTKSAYDSLFNELLWSSREEVLKERWHGIKYSNILLYRDHSDYSMEISYWGVFYTQSWYISINRRAVITIGYVFCRNWGEFNCECIENINMWKSNNTDNYYTSKPLSYCNPCCRCRSNCEAIYRSNDVYARHLHEKLKGLGDFKLTDDGNIEFDMPTTAPIEYIKLILWKFFDIALELRRKYKILEQPLQSSLFHNPDPYIYDEDYLEYFPFNCQIGSCHKEFMSEIAIALDSDPDFYYDFPWEEDKEKSIEDVEPPF